MSVKIIDFFKFQPNEPGLYGRISDMRIWIDVMITSDAQFCPNGGADAAPSRRRRKNKNKKKNKKDRKQKRKHSKEN